jgi:hypothetical protein
MAEPRDPFKPAPIVDESTQKDAIAAAEKIAESLPKVNPKTGNLPGLFEGKYGVFEAMLNDPIYGEELRYIKYVREVLKDEALADDLWQKSKWGQLDADAQLRYVQKLEQSDIYKERLKTWKINIKKQLAAKGLKADDATLDKYYIDGIDDTTILDELAGKISGKGAAGEVGNALEVLRNTARLNGFNLDKDFGNQIDGWLQRVSRGESVEDFSRLIRQQAKLGLPEKVSILLDEGLDLANIYAPYRNAMASLLEVTPDSISLDDPILRSAYGPDKETSIFDFKRAVRKDPRWQYTDNAREEVSTAALGVLRDFGFQG